MKKAILFALLVVGLTVSFFVGITVSQVPQPFVEKTYFLRDGKVFSHDALARETIQIDGLEKMRSQLVDLLQKRIKTMKEEELKAEIARLQKELREHEAKAKLQQAEKLLQEILKTHPKSQAAKQARKMLGTRRGSEGGEDAEADPAATATDRG